MHGVNLNSEQLYAYNLMREGYSVFITGDAGTGKSTVIKKFIDFCKMKSKQVAICAPTGIAAINVNGVTCHRLFKIPIVKNMLLGNPTDAAKEVIAADVIIIDEISMCRFDIFAYIVISIGIANQIRLKNGKKCIQLILSGDFFQLPPVIPDVERKLFNEKYPKGVGNGFAFYSSLWFKLNLKPVVLKTSVRQKDPDFAYNLNLARYGKVESLRYFSLNQSMKYLDNAITISGTNKEVYEINKSKLDKINAKLFTYEATSEGTVAESDKVVEQELNLKVGARVMTVINDMKAQPDYMNGSLGTVIDLTENIVTVQFDNGRTVGIERYTWITLDYEEEDGELELKEIGSYCQFPLKLGWAITIHKSQGQTYPEVNLNPVCWEVGQLYVALSRCTTANKIYFTRQLKPEYLKVSKDALKFYAQLELEMKNMQK